MSRSQLLGDIQLVGIETMTWCPFSAEHPRCPSGLVKHRESMPTSLIVKILEELGKLHYDGQVMFSQYNDPFTDPRFFWLCDKVASHMPEARIRLLTNSKCVDKNLLADLDALMPQIDVEINAYTPDEEQRLAMELKGNERYKIVCGRKHDSRLHTYDDEPHDYRKRPCGNPWQYLSIFVNGDLCVCCYDWKHSVILANLKEISLVDYLASSAWQNLAKSMKHGDRPFDVCSRCLKELPL